MPTPPSPPSPAPISNESQRLIDGLRAELDRLQSNLISLLDLRLEVARSIAELKAQAGAPLQDQAREQVILDSLSSKGRKKDGCSEAHLRAVFQTILEQTRSQITQES